MEFCSPHAPVTLKNRPTFGNRRVELREKVAKGQKHRQKHLCVILLTQDSATQKGSKENKKLRYVTKRSRYGKHWERFVVHSTKSLLKSF